VSKFASQRDAKEFLVNRIVAEAQRQGVSLSDVEKKMLYFSETAWTLPNIEEVNEAFEREYDQAKYERKIARLIRKIRANLRTDKEDRDAWKDAVRALGNEDHYILVLVGEGGAAGRPRGDFLKLVATALAIVCALLAVMFFAARR
jgi:hypothetical protein